jgi:hypothetical protein
MPPPQGVNRGHGIINKFFDLNILNLSQENSSFIELLFTSGFDATFYSTDEYQKLLDLLNDYNAIYVIDFANYSYGYKPSDSRLEYNSQLIDIKDNISQFESDKNRMENQKKSINNNLNLINQFYLNNKIEDFNNLNEVSRNNLIYMIYFQLLINEQKINSDTLNENDIIKYIITSESEFPRLLDFIDISDEKKEKLMKLWNDFIIDHKQCHLIKDLLNIDPFSNIVVNYEYLKKLYESIIEEINESINETTITISELNNREKKLINADISGNQSEFDFMGEKATMDIINHCIFSDNNNLRNLYIITTNYHGYDPYTKYFVPIINEDSTKDSSNNIILTPIGKYLDSNIIFLTGNTQSKGFDDYLFWIICILLSQFINKDNEINNIDYHCNFPNICSLADNINNSNSVMADDNKIYGRDELLRYEVIIDGDKTEKILRHGLKKGPSLFLITNDTQKLKDPIPHTKNFKNLYTELSYKNLYFTNVNCENNTYIHSCATILRDTFVDFNKSSHIEYYNSFTHTYENNPLNWIGRDHYGIYSFDTYNNRIYYDVNNVPIYYYNNHEPKYMDNRNNFIYRDINNNYFYYKNDYDNPNNFDTFGFINYNNIFIQPINDIFNILDLEVITQSPLDFNIPITISPFQIFAGLIYFIKGTYYSINNLVQSDHSMNRKTINDILKNIKF